MWYLDIRCFLRHPACGFVSANSRQRRRPVGSRLFTKIRPLSRRVLEVAPPDFVMCCKRFAGRTIIHVNTLEILEILLLHAAEKPGEMLSPTARGDHAETIEAFVVSLRLLFGIDTFIPAPSENAASKRYLSGCPAVAHHAKKRADYALTRLPAPVGAGRRYRLAFGCGDRKLLSF